MADLNKLNSRRKAHEPQKAESVSVRPSTRAAGDEELVQVVFRVSKGERTAFKRRTLDEGTTVQAVLESFVKSYIAE